MTGYEVTMQALTLLNYTTAGGEVDSRQSTELMRRAQDVVNTVLADILHIQRKQPQRIEYMSEELPVDEDVAMRVMVPGVAMYLAKSENDGDNYNRFSAEYAQRRSSVPKGTRRVEDVSPKVWL